MATARSLKDAVIKALAESPVLVQKCLDLYDAPPIFISGGTGRHGADTAPVFVIIPWARTAGEDDDRRSF